MQNKFKQEEIV